MLQVGRGENLCRRGVNQEVPGFMQGFVDPSFVGITTLDAVVPLEKTLETVSTEEFQMILVEFGTKTVDFGVFGEDCNRDKLPFQTMPLKV